MLQLNDLSLQPDQQIVPAEEYQAYLDAEGIVAAAKTQAGQILADAHREYDRQKQQGYDNGLMEGRSEIAEEMVNSVSKAVDYYAGLEGQLVDLVIKAMRKVLGEMDRHERIVAVVKQALAVSRTQPRVTVRVDSDDVEVVQQRLDEIMRPYPSIQFVDVVSDSRLDPGGCILETDIGVVDASIDVQLRAIEKSLAKSIGKPDSSGQG